MNTVPTEEQMIQYLLSELSEQEAESLESACLANDLLFEELLAIEAELTDDYIRGVLVGRRREGFERHLSNSTEREKNIQLAELVTGSRSDGSGSAPLDPRRQDVLMSSAHNSLNPRRLFVNASLAVAALVILLIGLGLFLKGKAPTVVGSPRDETAQNAKTTSSESTPPPPGDAATGGPGSQPSDKPGTMVKRGSAATFALTSGMERDAGNLNEIKIPVGVDRVRLAIDVTGSAYVAYNASLTKVEGTIILSRHNLPVLRSTKGQTLVVDLPAQSLPTGDLFLTVSGVGKSRTAEEIVGKYFLRTQR